MAEQTSQNLSPEAHLALAHTAASMRGPLRIFLELDARLARIVAATNEPMLGQMRLAWWRDVLNQAPDRRPKGDAVLDGIGEYWAGHEQALVALVDAWELLLGEELEHKTALEFAASRCTPIAALVVMAGGQPEAGKGAMRWALADAAAKVSSEEERSVFISFGEKELVQPARFPRALRGIAVLCALAERSIRRGGRPLMEGRGAALTAARAAIFGR